MIDKILQDNIKAMYEPDKSLNNKIIDKSKEQKNVKTGYRKIAISAIAASLTLFAIGGITLAAQNGRFSKRPSRDLSYDTIYEGKTFFVIPNENDSIEEYWEQITNNDMCDNYQKFYMGSAEIKVNKENINPEYLEFEKNNGREYIDDFVEQIGYLNMPVIIYTYEGCDKYVLYQESGLNNSNKLNYKGDAAFYCSEEEPLQLRLDTGNGFSDNYLDVSVGNIETKPEWFVDQAGEYLLLSVPYKDYINLNCNSSTMYVLRARDGYEKEFRDEVNKIVSGHGRTYEGSYFE